MNVYSLNIKSELHISICITCEQNQNGADHPRCKHAMIIDVQTQVEFEIHHAKMSNLTQVFVFSENKPNCKMYISFIILHHINS